MRSFSGVLETVLMFHYPCKPWYPWSLFDCRQDRTLQRRAEWQVLAPLRNILQPFIIWIDCICLWISAAYVEALIPGALTDRWLVLIGLSASRFAVMPATVAQGKYLFHIISEYSHIFFDRGISTWRFVKKARALGRLCYVRGHAHHGSWLLLLAE